MKRESNTEVTPNAMGVSQTFKVFCGPIYASYLHKAAVRCVHRHNLRAERRGVLDRDPPRRAQTIPG